ncbi:MAG: UDP-2,3-diacylglucosamine diphosphatase LpxI [Candidatus Aminicenantes bacterium]|nr:UDP-2,3-diacylglucosamine diphosphatase LpxI [Candidatus Aminicenantes bacterium]
MGNRIGVIAGSGFFPLVLIRKLKDQGKEIFLVAIDDEAERRVSPLTTYKMDLSSINLNELVDFLKKNSVEEVYLAGKVDPLWLLKTQRFDNLAKKLWPKTVRVTGQAVIEVFIDFLKEQGIKVLDPSPFLKPFFCESGSLTSNLPSEEALADLELAFEVAITMADLEIGQVVAVKKGVVVAIEALEGTDLMIERAGKLAGEGMVVAKVGRTRQSMIIDVPAIGPETIRRLIEMRAACLGIEAQKVAFFGQEEALPLAEKAGLAILAKSRKSYLED